MSETYVYEKDGFYHECEKNDSRVSALILEGEEIERWKNLQEEEQRLKDYRIWCADKQLKKQEELEANFEKKKEEMQKICEERINEADQRAEDAYSDMQRALDRKCQMSMDLEEMIRERDEFERIHIERANSERGITPKKEKDGYLILRMRQVRDTCPFMIVDSEDEYYDAPEEGGNQRIEFNAAGDRITLDVWQTTWQTPFDAWMNPEVIENKLFGPESHGIPVNNPDEETVVKSMEQKGILTQLDFGWTNVIYRWNLHCNLDSFWEVDVFSIKPWPEYRIKEHLPPHRTQKRTRKGSGNETNN